MNKKLGYAALILIILAVIIFTIKMDTETTKVQLETNHGTERNSLLNEYYRRVAYSNNKFSAPKKDGWRSDRGSVYCIMGEPDEIHSYDFPKRGRPYQIWTYYTKSTQYIFEYIGEDYVLRK